MIEDFYQLEYLDMRLFLSKSMLCFHMNSFRMPPETYILCSLEVVQFYNWAKNGISAANLTIEGWNEGHDYYCEDDKYHQLKSFKEYVDNHDMEPIPGEQVDTSIYLTKVKGRRRLVMA